MKTIVSAITFVVFIAFMEWEARREDEREEKNYQDDEGWD